MSSDTPESALPPPPLPPGAPPRDDALPGMKLGDYVVEKAVAWGGMGIVYRAVHPLLGRSVAVKVLRPNFAFDPEQAARFLKEAQAISAIKHRGIIDIISFGNLPDGRQYMVMEFLDGETLEEVMKREGAMSPARALALVDEVLDALSAAHKVGVVHRDLKPSNVFITMQSNGVRYVKLVDFGLARRAPIGDLNRIEDKASIMAGTPEYLSPEQVNGLAATPRTDLYSLGVMLFEMVTGELPFKAGSLLELLNAHRIETAPRARSLMSSLPVMLDDLIANCMQKEPAQRPSSADSARGTVQRLLRQLKDDTTHVVASPLKIPTDQTIRMEPKKDTDRLPSLPASMVTTARSEPSDVTQPRGSPLQAKTDPELPSRPLPTWVWGLMAGSAVALAIGVFLFKSRPPVELVDPPPIVAVAPPPEPPSALVETTATPIEATPTPTPTPMEEPKAPPPVKKREPMKKAAVVVRPEDLPEICEGANRKAKLGDASVNLLRQYALKVKDGRADPVAQHDLEALTARIKNAHDDAECLSLSNGYNRWKKKYVDP